MRNGCFKEGAKLYFGLKQFTVHNTGISNGLAVYNLYRQSTFSNLQHCNT